MENGKNTDGYPEMVKHAMRRKEVFDRRLIRRRERRQCSGKEI